MEEILKYVKIKKQRKYVKIKFVKEGKIRIMK